MQLQGQVKDMGLPEVFRLLKMSRKTGLLKVVNGRHWGDVYVQGGAIVDAAFSGPGGSLLDRLVTSGLLARDQFSALPAELRQADQPIRLRLHLLERDLVPQDGLAPLVRAQVEDTVFTLFGWPAAEFHFIQQDGGVEPEPLITLDAEAVIMEASRRIDEWRMIMAALGSLEKVPHLAPTLPREGVTISRSMWAVLALIDGRRDVNTIVADSGLDRFHIAKAVHSLIGAGLAVIREPTLELLGQKTAIALLGPIDLYNQAFLTSLCTSEVSSHLRLETLNDEEVGIHLFAAVREEAGESCLVYAAEARTPRPLLRRLALETSGYVVLVNINSRDSVVVSRKDIALLDEIGDRPYVVAAYASMADEKVSVEQVRDLLELPEKVPVLVCNLRDREETAEVLAALAPLLP